MMYLGYKWFLQLIHHVDGKSTSIYMDGVYVVHADMKGHDGTLQLKEMLQCICYLLSIK